MAGWENQPPITDDISSGLTQVLRAWTFMGPSADDSTTLTGRLGVTGPLLVGLDARGLGDDDVGHDFRLDAGIELRRCHDQRRNAGLGQPLLRRRRLDRFDRLRVE